MIYKSIYLLRFINQPISDSTVADTLNEVVNEKILEAYAKKYIRRRLERVEKADLGKPTCCEGIFYWDSQKN